MDVKYFGKKKKYAQICRLDTITEKLSEAPAFSLGSTHLPKSPFLFAPLYATSFPTGEPDQVPRNSSLSA